MAEGNLSFFPVLPRQGPDIAFYGGKGWSAISQPVEPRVSFLCIGCGHEKTLWRCRYSDGSVEDDWMGCLCPEGEA